MTDLFNKNYDYLNTVAKRITRCKDYRRADDLLSSTYLVLYEKGTKYPEDSEEFVKWFCKCMKNYFAWPNSEFNKTYYSKESLSIDSDLNSKNRNDNTQKHLDTGFSNKYNELLVDEGALREIETLAEDTNDFTKELFQISSNMGTEKTLKYIELQEFKQSLPAHEVILFELYYEKELSTRKIAIEYSDENSKMNYQSVNQMINKIKTKINNYQWRS